MFETLCIDKYFVDLMPTDKAWAFKFELKAPDRGKFLLYYSNEHAFTIGNTYSFGIVVED